MEGTEGVRTRADADDDEAARTAAEEEAMTKSATVSSGTIRATGRWDAKYNIAIVEWLKAEGLKETPVSVLQAIAALKGRDQKTLAKARGLREQAQAMTDEAKRIEETVVTTTGQGRKRRQR